jgi:hypothetical protein
MGRLVFFASSKASCQFVRHGINSDMLMSPCLPHLRKRNRFLGEALAARLLALGLLSGRGLNEAAVSLSATWLARMAATIMKTFQLEPIVAQQQPDFLGPGLRAGQVSEKGPRAGAGSLFLIYARCFCLLPVFAAKFLLGFVSQFAFLISLIVIS